MSNQSPSNTSIAKPYKGPESYQVEDGELFFGRDDEAEQVIARVLTSRFTLLHAQSGAGKTSLVNARIIPRLEARGWNAFRVLPQNDPIESIRAGTFQYVLPSPAAEQLAIERAWQSLAPDNPDLTIDELLHLYDELEIRDARRRALVRRLNLPVSAASTELSSEDPYFCRLLRSCIEMETFADHVLAIKKTRDRVPSTAGTISGQTRLRELIDIFSDTEFVSTYNTLINELKVPGRDLNVFFEHLIETYGGLRTSFNLVLILDQFEEMFTRFIDPGVTVSDYAGDLPDWRLRWELFEQLGRLCSRNAETPTNAPRDGQWHAGQPLPIRYVVSMRDEYIAQMEPMRQFVAGVEESSYHLMLLDKQEAQAAIQEPARIFGYTYEPECFARIVEQLTKEDRYVEPAHLQLVCDKLWNEKGRELARREQEQTTGEEKFVIEQEVFKKLGETRGILKSFFTDFLDETDRESRQEILDILEPLVTTSGTRNIIERDRLINAPFRNRQKRRELLDLLVNRTIVRTEPRLGGYFVEITHEFLIAPVLAAIAEAGSKDPEYRAYKIALRTLERLHGSSIAGTTPPLNHQEFLILNRHRDAVWWDSWSAEAMFRCAIAYGYRDLMEIWLQMFPRLQTAAPLTVPALMQSAINQGDREILCLAELRMVNENRAATTDLSREQVELIWRSELTWAVDAEVDDVKYWTQRMKAHG